MKVQVRQIQGRNKITLNTDNKLGIGKTYQYIFFAFKFSYNKCLFEMESY